MSATWGAGTIILGRYRLDSLLGRGGMGSVWRAEHLQLRSPVAIKLLDDAISHNPQVLARFMREAQAAALLRSPHVVQIFDVGVEAGTAFIVMELLRGESLRERIARLKRLPAEEAIGFLCQVLRAIAKAHEAGIVHRDLKPDNIFICAEEPEFAKVLDFGVAKVTAGELIAVGGGRTQPGTMIGTPYYMSPEQMQARDVDARSDLWSIAVIAYECLVGSRPFTGEELGELVLAICTGTVPVPSQHAEVPAGFDEWFVKATQRDRERRFGSAREMADELIQLSSIPGASRAQFITVRNAAALSIPVPRTQSLSSRVPAADNLNLTTGQRAATSESLPHLRARTSAAVYGALAAAALLVIGGGAFVASRGASAFKAGVGPEGAAATLTAPIRPPSSEAPMVPAASTAPSAAHSSAPALSASASSSALPAATGAPAPQVRKAPAPGYSSPKPKPPAPLKMDSSEFGLRR